LISTSWNTPSRGSETTTNAGELSTVPVAQLGWQLLTVNVPLPLAVVPQEDHVTEDIVMSPAHPISRVTGRTWGFDPALHGSTVGAFPADTAGGEAFVGGDGDVTGATEALVTTLLPDVGDPGELMANPREKPTPRPANTAAATPVRTTTLRRMANTPPFRGAVDRGGTVRAPRPRWFPTWR
jgi:hypothetical protein